MWPASPQSITSLREINPGTGDVRPIIDVDHFLDRAAVNTDAQMNLGMTLESRADLHRAFEWRLETVEKDEVHPVTGREANQLSRCFGRAEARSLAREAGQVRDKTALVIDQQRGVANHVHREDMGDFQFRTSLSFSVGMTTLQHRPGRP